MISKPIIIRGRKIKNTSKNTVKTDPHLKLIKYLFKNKP